MADIARLVQVVEPQAAALGLELVRVRLTGAGEERTLQVMAEDPATGQLVVEQCAALSHRISDAIDAIEDAGEEAGEELIAGAYHLEVSSPGIDRPLTRARDFANWAGHEAKLRLAQPVAAGAAGAVQSLRGELLGIAEDEAQTVSIRDGRAGLVRVPLAGIESAQLVLTERLLAAARPLDPAGVDDFEAVTDEQIDEEEAHN